MDDAELEELIAKIRMEEGTIIGWADDMILHTIPQARDDGRDDQLNFDVSPRRDPVRDDEVLIIAVRVDR